MSYMHTADLVLHKWNKKPCTSTTEKKTNKQGQESEGKKGGGGGAGKKKVLTSSGSTPKSLQSFSTPSGPMVSGSSWPLSNENKN